MKFRLLFTLVTAAAICPAQLTEDQKVSDLRMLASIYAKGYGPYEWKRDVMKFDLFDLGPWIERAKKTTTDLEFADLCVDYVSSLNDAHDVISFPSTFLATLNFYTDLYDGKALIDSITRSRLPVDKYPFVIGDELVSVDGISVEEWISKLRKYSISANPRSTARTAVFQLTYRRQTYIPMAPLVGDSAQVVIRRASTGELETYTIPWVKSGVALESFGKLLSPFERSARTRSAASADFLASEDMLEPWQRPLAHQLDLSVADRKAILSGGIRPIFALPQGFQVRLGVNTTTDAFTSGVYQASGLRVGFIRVSSMSPSIGTSAALAQFEREIEWMNANTDGLVIDIMRNPGGSVLYVENLCARLTPYMFRNIAFEYRPVAADVVSFKAALESARAAGLPDYIVAGYENRYNDVATAFSELRGRTGPISLTQPFVDALPWPNAYAKPIIVLTDEFSASGGDAFPATLQDNQRATIVGFRTMGAGGNVVDVDGTIYSEGVTRVTRSLMNRKTDIVTAEYPAAPYVENIGVRPDVEIDYMTRENLMNAGRPFVDAFTQIIVDKIKKAQGN